MAIGDLDYYGLLGWWFETFTPIERQYIVERYQPMGGRKNSLIEGEITYSSGSAENFLAGLLSWFRSPNDTEIFKRILSKLHDYTYNNGEPRSGLSSQSYLYVEDIKELKRSGKLNEAKALLINCVKDLSRSNPPWFYDQLRIVCNKLKQLDEAYFFGQLHEEAVINEMLRRRDNLMEMPEQVRRKYYPNGVVVPKKYIKILEKHGITLEIDKPRQTKS